MVADVRIQAGRGCDVVPGLRFLLGNAIVFIHTWNGITRERPGSRPSNFSWYTLFRDQIRPPSPLFARWTGRASSLSVALAAAIAGRPVLAAAWVLAGASYIARDRWEEGVVRRELRKIKSR